MLAPSPSNEASRLATLRGYEILDTPPESTFDDLVQLAAQICETPVAMISLVDSDRQWFKAQVGTGLEETARGISFCQHALANGDALLLVPDATRDPRFRDSPLVTGQDRFRFYAGAPLTAPAGEVIGTLCVVDHRPRKLSPTQEFGLRTLAAQVMVQLESRRLGRERDREADRLQKALDQVRQLERIIDHSPVVAMRWHTQPEWRADYVSRSISQFGYTPEDMTSGRATCFDLLHPDDVAGCLEARRPLVTAGMPGATTVQRAYRIVTKSGKVRWLHDVTWCVEIWGEGHGVFEAVMMDVTEERERAEQLRMSEERFRALSTASPVGIFEADASGQITFVNQRMLELLRASEAIIRGDEWLQCVHSQDRARVVGEWTTCVRGGSAYLTDFRIVRPDREIRWVHATARAMHDGEGRVTGFVGTIDDVTDYHVAAEALHREETLYRSLVTNLKEVVFQTDAVGWWTFLNPAWQELTGLDPDESLGTAFLDRVHPDDRERCRTEFQALVQRTRDHCQHEVRYLTRGGAVRWVKVVARLTLDAGGHVIGTTGTMLDITARKEAEEMRRRQLAAIEGAIDGVAILDDGGRYIYVNATHLELFGLKQPSDLIGRSWRELYAPEQVAWFEREVFPLLSQTRKWRGEVAARRVDGALFAQEVSLTLIEGGGLVCVCRDLSERHAAHERIQAALREKDVMLKEIHHRVKNNMQIVSSLLNLQLDDLRDPQMRELFVDAQTRIAAMALVHEKLYQSHDLARINFAEYLRDLTEGLVSAQGARRRGVVFTLEAADLRLGIDTAIPCGLVVTELVTNCYKHGFPQGGPGEVRVVVQQSEGEELRLEVRDNGRGLPADYDPAHARSLGMKLVLMLVRQLRGTLTMPRSSGVGACFVIVLPDANRRRRGR